VRLGIGLPTYTGNAIEPRAVLRWAERAERLGFDAVSVSDRPSHETWDPLVTLAAVAAVTERVRLATAAIILPTRNEALLVKQAAVVDRALGSVPSSPPHLWMFARPEGRSHLGPTDDGQERIAPWRRSYISCGGRTVGMGETTPGEAAEAATSIGLRRQVSHDGLCRFKSMHRQRERGVALWERI
jgi:luciferase-like monooxygenase